jgi:hypothetical protein
MVTKSAVAAVNAVLAGQSALWYWYAKRPVAAGVSSEHGPLEDFQVFSIGLGFLLVLARAGKADLRAERFLFFGMALLFATFVLLEYDTRAIGSPLVVYLFNGRLRDVWLGALWAIMIMAFLFEMRGVWIQFWRWLPTGAGWMLLAAGIFWTLGALQEKSNFIPEADHFVEELFEVNASLLMLFSAWASWLQQLESVVSIPTAGERPRQ